MGWVSGEGLQLLWKMSNEWPVPQTWHLNEDQALTQSENEASWLGPVPWVAAPGESLPSPTVHQRTAKVKLSGQLSHTQ